MATITVSDNTTGSTVGGIEDNELTGFNTTQQLGSAVQAYIDAWQAPDVYVTYIMRIPIPSGSGTVSNAKLRLYMTEKGGSKTALSVYEILRTDWSESQSTYNIYKTSNNWTTGGAQGVGTDRGSSAIATCNVSGTSVNNYIEFTGSGLTTLIQNAVDGAISSINVIVQFTDLSFTSQNFVRWRTSEGTDGQRPQLVYDLTSSASGTSATTNANDTSSASGTTTVTGTSARTNSNDTSNSSGTTTIIGTLSKTNANDTSNASGSVGQAITGSVTYTNVNDTSNATGTTTVTGTSAKTNSNDTSSASGTTTVLGAVTYTNRNDTSSASGVTGTISGTVAYTNNNDVAYAYDFLPTSTSAGVSSSFYKRRRIIIERQEKQEEEPEVIVRKVKRLIARKIKNKQIAQKVQAQVIEQVQFQSIDLTQAQQLIDDLKQQEILARMRRKQMQDDEEAIQFFL